MKKILYYSLLIALGHLLAGCAEKAEESMPGGQTLTVSASFDDGSSRATVVDGGVAVYWEPGDEIKVFCGPASGRMASTNAESSATATFTGPVSGEVNPSAGNRLYALYPYREDAGFDGGAVTTVLPEEQTAVKGSFDRNANIAMAVSDSRDLQFKNVCGGLRFTLTHPGIRRIVFESNGGEYIAGVFSARFEGGVPVVTEVKDGSRTVTLKTEDGSAFETGVWYYMSFLPITLAEGYTVTFSTDTEAAALAVGKAQTVKRGTYGTIPDIDNGLQWNPEEFNKNSFVLKDNVLSIRKQDVARFISSIGQDSFMISEDAPLSLIPSVGEAVFVETGKSDIPYILGKVADVIKTKSSGYTVTTEDAGLGDIFKEFNICEDITLSDVPQYITDEDGNSYECGLASPDIWDELTTPASDTTSVICGGDSESVSKKPFKSASSAKGKSRYPRYVKIANNILHGNLYLDFTAHPDIRFDGEQNTVIFNIPCEVRLGFEGDIGLELDGDKSFNMLQKIKIPVGSAGFLQFYFVPDLSIFCEGKVTIGGDAKLEFYHGSFVMTNETGKSCEYASLEKDRYFNIAKFKSDGAIGIRYGAGIHSCVFNEKLFGFGMDLTGSLKAQVSGEFPSEGGKELSKNLTARIQPTVDLAGYVDWRVALNRPDKLEIPIFSASLTPYDVDLLPLFKLVSSKVTSGGKKALVQAKAFRNSFISSTEGGYCLFEKGNDVPLSYKQIYGTRTKTSSSPSTKGNPVMLAADDSNDGGLSFDLEVGKTYEIAPYTIVNEGEYVYGEKTPLDIPLCPDENHIHAIDLGLSVKWACCNVGASKPEEFGGYFAWGETAEKSYYDWDTYRWGSGRYELSKYCTDSFDGTYDGRTTLDPGDDVAHVRLGGSWRMPTRTECDELIDNCTSEWTTLNGVKGRKFTSRKNGNSIFLPAAGSRGYDGLDTVGSRGLYWSSSLCTDDPSSAYNMLFFSGYVGMIRIDRCGGRSVRPVSE